MPTAKQELRQQLRQLEAEAHALPVSRRVGKAAVLQSAPAYSFGGRYKQSLGEGTPGPGTYAPFGTYSVKGASFGSSARLSKPNDLTPSPMDYAPSVAPVRHSSSSFTFGAKNAGKQRPENTPGPGAYDAGSSKDKQRPNNPPVSISPKLKPPSDADKKPGPTAYSPKFSPKEPRSATIKFRHSSESPYKSPSPGPGAYKADPKSPKTAGYTMAGKRPHTTGGSDSPGPVYSADRSIDAVLPGRAAYSFPRAQSSYHVSEGPGPGNYTQEPVVDRPAGYSVVSQGRSQPAYTMQGKPFFFRPPPHPGPLDYKPREDVTRKSAPAIAFHGSSIKDSREGYPGPGHYVSEDAHKALHPSSPPITMSPKYKEPNDQERRPGPTAYSPKFEPKEPHAASIKFRHQPRFYSMMHGTPAPHDYANKDFVSPYANTGKLKRGKTFGVRHLSKGTEYVPGPQYNIGCSTLGVAAQSHVSRADLSRSQVLL